MATVKAADLASSALESRARWRRRRAARRLGRMWGAAAAQHLARVFEFSDDEAVATIARRGLDGVVDQLAIDAVCEQWKANRSPRISELLAQKGWIAEQPVELRVLTALHQDRPEAITGGGPEVAEELLRIAADDGSELRERARGALVSLSDPAAGEAVCAAAIDRGDATALEAAVAADFVPREPAGHALLLFLTGRIERYRDPARNPKLSALIADRGWIAARPPELRVLTALLNDRLELLADAIPGLARALVAVADDDDPPWLDQAREALTTLRRQDAREAVCGLAIEGGSSSALQAAMKGGFIPAEPHRYAVLLLLAREFDRHADLDFDGSLLAAVYFAADEDLRVRLSACVRESGRVDWVRAVAGGKRLEALSDFDWQLLIRTLHAAQRWDQLWDLMRRAPAVWGVRIVIQLAGSGWVPNDPLRRRIYDGVLPSARAYEAAAFRGPGDYWQPSSMSELLKPIAEINPLEIENLRQPRTSHAERALAEFAVALARWHRAHDVALEDAAAGAPLAGDIEVESGE